MGPFGFAAAQGLGDAIPAIAGGIFGGLFGGGKKSDPKIAQKYKYDDATQDLDMARRLTLLGGWHPQIAGMFFHNQGAQGAPARLAEAFGYKDTGQMKEGLFNPMGNTAGHGFGLGGGRFGQNAGGGSPMFDLDAINSQAQSTSEPLNMPKTKYDQLLDAIQQSADLSRFGLDGGHVNNYFRQQGQLHELLNSLRG